MSQTVENKFKLGDLVKTTTNQKVYEEKEWYGMVIGINTISPCKYPVYATKYRIKWCGGESSWAFGSSLELVSSK